MFLNRTMGHFLSPQPLLPSIGSKSMRLTVPRIVRPLALTIALLSCTENGPAGPTLNTSPRFNVAGSSQSVVISQVYGGGGNSGATIRNDFIEVFNNGIDAVDLTGWSLQYGSTAGNFNSSPNVPTPLSGTLAPGHYLLIQEFAGAGGTISLAADIIAPTPIAMAATAGKVALVRNSIALTCGTSTTRCGSAGGVIADLVGYGGASDFEGTAAPTLTNTTAALRGLGGCTDTDNNSTDFASGAPTPRNGATAPNVCDGVVSEVDHITVAPVTAPAAGTVAVGATLQFTAHVFDVGGNDITATNPVTWSTSPTGFATISSSGLATGTNAGSTSVVAAAGGKTGNAPLTVTGGGSGETGDIVISQIYGGGNNSGATYRNDYIELFNHGTSAVNVSGWSVQYASSAGTTWAVTPLSGTIQPGHYLLVQEAGGTTTGAALPTADVTGTINLSGTAGKVILTSATTAQTGACPSGVVDRVGFGAASNCTSASDWGGATATLSNTTAAVRKDDGCTNTNNASNDFTVPPPTPSPRNSSSAPKTCVPPVPLPQVHFSELHYDNIGTDVNEKIEIEGPANRNLTGWSVVLYGGDAAPDFSAYSTTTLGVSLPTSCGTTGVIVVSYAENGIKNAKFNGTGNPAGMALVNNTGAVVEFLSYEGTFTALDGPAAGMVSTDIGVAEVEPGPAPGNSLHRSSAGGWSAASAQDFGVCNGTGGPPPESTNHFTFSGRFATDPALPVGFEDQLFATEHDGATNAVINTTVTWSSDIPGIATIDRDGVFRGVSDGIAILRATGTDGTTTTISLPIVTNTFSATADWSGNLEFGTPTDANPDNDFIITHDQFTSSYSLTRDIPNWVSAKLDASHYGTNSDRCDCFTFDPAVPSNLYYTTNAWTGVGTTWNRGHLLRSADVESSAGDNSIAYYFSNIAPQSAQMNQGPWAVEENFLGDMAKNGGKDVYEIVGVSGSVGTLKNEGRVTIPGYFWKVAVIVPHGRKLADIHSSSDLDVISVIMPNVASVNSDWTTYKTTVHTVEQLSGYDLLDKFPDDIELLVEDAAPTAVLGGDLTGVEAGSVSFDGSNSTDADDDHLSYAWDFGDGTTGSGAQASHIYADNGQYIVKLTVTDPRGRESTASNVVTVSNASPSVVIASSGPIASGATYSLAGGFGDPGQADAPWSYTINWGDGFSSVTTSTSSQGALGGTHKYFTVGSYTVTLTVIDKDGGSGSASTTVQVARILGSMSVTPSPINIGNNGNGQIVVTVFGNSTFDGTAINLSTARIGNTSVDVRGNSDPKAKFKDVNHDGILDLVVHFVRGDLVANGDLSSNTILLALDANLNDGRQIEARGPVEVTSNSAQQ